MLDLSRVPDLGEALRDALFTFPTNTALIECDRRRETGRWSFREARDESERVTARLQARGMEPGARVAILMSNQARWILSGLGVFQGGGVLVPLDYKLTAPEQAALLRHCRPTILITEWATWRTLRDQELPAGLTVLVSGEAPKRLPASSEGAPTHAHEPWDAPVESKPRFVTRGRADVACIVYSSGTGGTPKGCLLTHGNYLAQAEMLGRLYPMEEGETYFSILPTNHAIDFMCGFLLPLMFGGTIVHQRTLRPEFLAATMKDIGITWMALVPMVLKSLESKLRERLDKLPDWNRRVLDGLIAVNDRLTARRPNHAISRRLLGPVHEAFGGELKTLFCGGAFVDRASADFFAELGIPVAIGYGLTEAGTVITVNDLSPYRGDSVGAPLPGLEVELRGDDGGAVALGEIGEVVVRGPTVMKGYLDEPELTAETLVDGWLHTGDLGHFDASGHLHLVGRRKNMIVTAGGKNVYPEDIEHAFEDLPEVEEHALFASGYLFREQPGSERLVLVLRTESGQLGAELLDELRMRNRGLADYKRVEAVLAVAEEFPRTASLKVKRGALAEQLREACDAEALITL